jgi:GNAT superfamily N-acetyltransferase
MDGAEAGGGEGDEQPRMPGDRLGDALAASQADAQELVASARYTSAHGGQRAARRVPHAFSSTPSGWLSVSNTVRASPVSVSIEELAGPDAPRFLGVNKLFDDHHPHGSYWYLQFLGVAPGWQGQGIGSGLMAPVLARCDREGVRAYLDATTKRNKRLYERHGFQAEDPFAPPGGPPLWPMWRQPASDR